MVARDGMLIPQDRDGSSRLLEWLSPLWPAWSITPSFANRTPALWEAARLTMVWMAAAAVVAWLCHRSLRDGSRNRRSEGSRLHRGRGARDLGRGAVLGAFEPFDRIRQHDVVPMLDSSTRTSRRSLSSMTRSLSSRLARFLRASC